MPKGLVKFNLRIRLAIGIQISYDTSIARAKEPVVRETYELLIRLMENWNAFDVLCKYAKAQDKIIKVDSERYTIPEKSPYRSYNPFNDKVLKDAGCIPFWQYEMDCLKTKCAENEKFRAKFKEILTRYEKNAKDVNGKKLQECCAGLIQCFFEGKDVLASELLGFIYATRNSYYHSGELAGEEFSYSDRRKMLKSLIPCFQKHILLLASYIITKEINIKQCSYANLQ